ncbi:Arg81p [Sugiyamaella lignohabitans]|uniref:Arg81p n=1 Tax=Sugiyamaella lignohabitans TaxID=796027 RepID=A0A167DMJ7_9ASCO|nr:Arg81p [Sugiyamaella lignohabitans]ANB13074.1 Arg81p [Sugiyamaella lignohabitans]
MIYDTYDEMDSVLAKLHSPSFAGDETVVLGPFGVFEGVKHHRARRGRKRDTLERSASDRAVQRQKLNEADNDVSGQTTGTPQSSHRFSLGHLDSAGSTPVSANNANVNLKLDDDIALLTGTAASLVAAGDAALRKAQSKEEIAELAGSTHIEDSPADSVGDSIAESFSSFTQAQGGEAKAHILPYIPSEKAEYEALHEELSTLLSFPNDDIFTSGYFDIPSNMYDLDGLDGGVTQALGKKEDAGSQVDGEANPHNGGIINAGAANLSLDGNSIEQQLQQLHSTIPNLSNKSNNPNGSSTTGTGNRITTNNSQAPLLFIPLSNGLNHNQGQLKYILPGTPSAALPKGPLFAFSPQAQYLLDYYDQNVIKIMTVVAHPKNPWRTIYLPRAYSAIGDIIGKGQTSAARNALLHALLAVSAFHIQRKFSAESDARQHYLSLGLRLKSEAYKWLSKCLVDDLMTQKYKDVVTAVLSMVTIDVIWGGMADCQIHLAACQSIVRLRHKTRKLTSRKAMILQRISGFLTLLQRATVVDPDSVFGFADDEDEDDRYNDEWMELRLEDLELTPRPKNSVANSTMTSPASQPLYSQSSLSYMRDPSQFQEYWHQYSNVNAQSLSDEFYAKELVSTQSLYGIPDSLIILFHEACKQSRQGLYYRSKNEPFPLSLTYKCKELESALVNWQARYDINKTTNFTGQVKEALNHHTLAFHQALIIYHYRLARDVNPSALRSHVLAVLDHLEKMHQINMTHPEPLIIPLLFPVFMAACETTNSSDMARFNAILDRMTVEGLGTYYTALKVISEVWKRREANVPNAEWWSILREWKANIMLS